MNNVKFVVPILSPTYFGGFNEERPEMYKQELFTKESRYIHMGVDFEAPARTEVYAIGDGIIHAVATNKANGDYGPTLILEHTFNNQTLFALYGHLSTDSLAGKSVGQKINQSEIIGWLGDETENGGWPPHLHLQISKKPAPHGDMQGVVSLAERENALKIYVNPIELMSRK